MENFVKKKKIRYLINIAGLSRQMILNKKKIDLSINFNIIETAKIVNHISYTHLTLPRTHYV